MKKLLVILIFVLSLLIMAQRPVVCVDDICSDPTPEIPISPLSGPTFQIFLPVIERN